MTQVINARDALAEHLNGCVYWLLGQESELGIDLTPAQNDALKVFEKLRDTVDDVPPETLQSAEQFMMADPETYDRVAGYLARNVVQGFAPADATAYVEALNNRLKLITSPGG